MVLVTKELALALVLSRAFRAAAPEVARDLLPSILGSTHRGPKGLAEASAGQLSVHPFPVN